MWNLASRFETSAARHRRDPRSRHRAARGASLSVATFIILAGSVNPGAFGSTDTSPVVATVNGEPLTILDLDALLATQARPAVVDELPPGLDPEGLLQRLIQNRLLEQEGYRIEAEKRPEVRNQVWDLKRHKGMMALLDSVSKAARDADDSALVQAMQQQNTILRVSQILLNDKDAAEAILDSLRAGVAFADLADRHSQDTTSVIGPGGDLGWAREDRFIPEFATALEGLAPGEYSEPVQTERGWHIIELVERRTETAGQSEAMETAIRDAARGKRVMGAVEGFVASLFEKYDARIDSTLLRSLDYGSEDSKVQTALQSNDAVLVRFPWKELTVRDLSQEIRFKHFHGIAGKPDAAQLRDKAFHDWTTELLLRHEASVLGFDRRPRLLIEAEALERKLVREVVIGMVVDAESRPSEAEIEAYYQTHQEGYRSTSRFRVNGVLLRDEAAAEAALQMLRNGARLGWVAANAPGVIDRKPEGLSGWKEPSDLGLSGEVRSGDLIGPTLVDDAWAVSEVVELEPSKVLPLNECRERVLQAMQGEQMTSAIQHAVERLEAGAEIDIKDDAEQRVQGRLESWLGRPTGAR